MSKLILLLTGILLSISQALGNQARKDIIPLELNCSVVFQDYNGIDEASITKQATLKDHKHKTGGSVLVTQTNAYEFWVITHGVQAIANKTFIREFQVAIRHKQTGLFMHALSDVTNSPDISPKRARISLVTYHPDTTQEKGELLFECSSLS